MTAAGYASRNAQTPHVGLSLIIEPPMLDAFSRTCGRFSTLQVQTLCYIQVEQLTGSERRRG